MTLWRKARADVAGAWRSVCHDRGGRPGPRRLAAVGAFGILAVAGAAGSYFAVLNGLGSLADERQRGAEPYPLAVEAPRGSEGELANSGLGRGTAETTRRTPARATTAAPAPEAGTGPPEKPQPRRPTAPSEPVATPDGCCLSPPAPTPTAPASVPPSHSPSVTPSPSASEPEDSKSPEPSGSPSSASPSQPAEDPSPEESQSQH